MHKSYIVGPYVDWKISLPPPRLRYSGLWIMFLYRTGVIIIKARPQNVGFKRPDRVVSFK